MEYKVLVAARKGRDNLPAAIGKLEDMVNLHIEDGWKPLGGLVIANTVLTQIAQAIVRGD